MLDHGFSDEFEIVLSYPFGEWGGEFAMSQLVASVKDAGGVSEVFGGHGVSVAQVFQMAGAVVTSWARSRLPCVLSQESRMRLVLRPCSAR